MLIHLFISKLIKIKFFVFKKIMIYCFIFKITFLLIIKKLICLIDKKKFLIINYLIKFIFNIITIKKF